MNELHKRDAAAWTMGASAAVAGALAGAGGV